MQIVKNINEKCTPFEKLVVLLAEEHPLSAKIQQKGLEEGGFQVLLVKTWEEMTAHLKKEKIDILMLDTLFCSHKNILTSLPKLKQVSFNSQIKIILTTVMSSKSDANKNISHYADLFITKPIPQDKLIHELKKLSFKNIRGTDRIFAELQSSIYIDNKVYKNKMIDISESGFFLGNENNKIKKVLGSILKIELELPKYKNPILFNAIIVRKTKDGYGLKITDISNENKLKLAKFIEKVGLKKEISIYYL